MTEIINKHRQVRGKRTASKADIKRIVKAQETGDWTAVHTSKLYQKHSGDYCYLLELIAKQVIAPVR